MSELERKTRINHHPDFVPVAEMTRANLLAQARKLERDRDYDFFTETHGQLAIALTWALAEDLASNPTALREKLFPFSEAEELGEDTCDWILTLYQDLEYANWIAEGGLKAVNENLARMFRQIRESDRPYVDKELLYQINRLLYRAIYFFPHLATGIELSLPGYIDPEDEKFKEIFGRGVYHYRWHLDWLKKAAGIEQFKGPIIATLPLPYAFWASGGGSASRAARGQSQEDILLTCKWTKDDERKMPLLSILIQGPSISPSGTLFLLEEIGFIRFATGENQFLPRVGGREENPRLVKRAENSVLHYLRFRNFSNRSLGRLRQNLLEIEERKWQIINERLLMPGYGTNLWDFDLDSGQLACGFLVLRGQWLEDNTMYEIQNIPYADLGWHEIAVAKIMNRILTGEYSSGQVKKYQGREIVKKLATIPVEERNF